MINSLILGFIFFGSTFVDGQFNPNQGGNPFPPQGGNQFPGPGNQFGPGPGQNFGQVGLGGFGPGPNNAGFPIPGRNNIVISDPFQYATCYFNESGSTNIKGRVDFRQARSGGPTFIRIQVQGLPPSLMSDTEHGIHIHEYGDIGKGCYASGRHFDADGFSFHGSPNNLGAGNSHDGDLGNLRQTNNGDIDALLTIPIITLTGDFGVIGRAVVLKEGRDDLGRGQNAMSLQTGNAGAPIACCTIALSDSTNWYSPLMPSSTNNPFNNMNNNNNFNNNFNVNNNNPQFNQGGFNNPQNPTFNVNRPGGGPGPNQFGPRFGPNQPFGNPGGFAG